MGGHAKAKDIGLQLRSVRCASVVWNNWTFSAFLPHDSKNLSAKWWDHQAMRPRITTAKSAFPLKIPLEPSEAHIAISGQLQRVASVICEALIDVKSARGRKLSRDQNADSSKMMHFRRLRWESKRRFAIWRLFIAAWRSDTYSTFCGDFPEYSGVVKDDS